MKNNVKKLLCIITISLIVGTLSSCAFASKEKVVRSMPEMKERYATVSAAEMSNKRFNAEYSFYDDDYEYYIFYLGCVSHVPLQDNVNIYEFNGNEHEKSFTTTAASKTEISKMLSEVETRAVTLGVSASSKFKGTGEILNVGLEASQTKSASRSQSISKAVEYSSQTTETTRFCFDGSWEKGFYRYILLGDVDVFGVLIKDINSGDCYTYTYDVIAAQYYSLDYSRSALFDEHSDSKLSFSLSTEEIEALERPSRYVCTRIEYASDVNAKKIDASHEYTYDEFNISALSPFMNSEYTLCFDIRIEMKEENAGYQEIYLCKDDETHITGVAEYEFGGNGKASTTYDEVKFNWTVRGDECTEIMKLRYGAHGEGSDDWYRRQAKVIVTIQK